MVEGLRFETCRVKKPKLMFQGSAILHQIPAQTLLLPSPPGCGLTSRSMSIHDFAVAADGVDGADSAGAGAAFGGERGEASAGGGGGGGGGSGVGCMDTFNFPRCNAWESCCHSSIEAGLMVFLRHYANSRDAEFEV